MGGGDVSPPQQRVLVLAAADEDVAVVRSALSAADCAVEFHKDVRALCGSIEAGAGAAIVADGAASGDELAHLLATLSRQPPWSDLPLVLLGADDAGPCAPLVAAGFNVTILERPVHAGPLGCAVRSALRARRRQYELRDLLADARLALRQRDEFLAMLGHELRNPLGVISSAVQILNRIGSRDREASETRDMIERQTSHLTRLVDDLLDVSRVSSGKIVLKREPVGLNEAARQCFQGCASLIAAQRHEVTFAPSPEPAVVDGDPVRLEQIVHNLLSNAVKYTPAGGRILVAVSRDGAQAVLRVRDNGMGIEPDMLERVFDMFTQADRSLDRAQGGVGMGLTLVKRLVEMHGGFVSASSAGIGRGSEFEVRLPASADVVTPPPRPTQGPTEPRPRAPATPRHVLIVEDGPDARNALGRLLQLWGHHVELAEDGTRGVERALASRPEVALIDIGLPGLNGYEVARRVRQVLGDRIRLIALTGYGQPDDQERTREAGFDQHLVKPVNPRLLSRLLAGEAPPAGR